MKYKYWYMNLKKPKASVRRLLLKVFQSAQVIYTLSESELKNCAFLGQKDIREFLEERGKWNLDGEYQKFCATGLGLVTVEDREYPCRLKNIYNPPYGLYFAGDLSATGENSVAIVGARNCSEYGRKVAREISFALGKRGYSVISGMARGIDSHAHQGCLDGGGKTVAVLGCGTDVCYPKENKRLYEQIKSQGCIFSEYLPGTAPQPQFFPARNRIISGLSKSVIVVEAREKSGSLITMDFALEQGKDVYSVPGRITDPLSVGCNRLIAQGAGILTSIEDLLSNMEEIQSTSLEECISGVKNDITLSPEQQRVYECFDYYPKAIETVAGECQMDLLQLLDAIMELCEKGFLREVYKNEYVRCT